MAKGIIFFIIACLADVIVYQIGFTMMDSLTTAGDIGALTTDEQAIIWLGMIIIWVLMTLVLPAHFIMEGLKENG